MIIEGVIAQLALTQRCGRLPGAGDVHDGAQQLHGSPVRVSYRLADGGQPNVFAVFAPQSEPGAVRLVILKMGVERDRYRTYVVSVDPVYQLADIVAKIIGGGAHQVV